jgi:PmbA protein
LNADERTSRRIFDCIRKLSTADEVEVLFSGGRFALTRFANNTIHQNVAEENYVVSVRAAFGGGRRGPLPTSLTMRVCGRSCGLRRVWRRVQHPDPDLLPMPDARSSAGGTGGSPVSTQTIPSRHFETTAAITPELRAEGVKKIVGVAQQHKLTTAGVFSSAESLDGIFNSRGLSNWHQQTSADVSITMLASGFFRLAESEFTGCGET